TGGGAGGGNGGGQGPGTGGGVGPGTGGSERGRIPVLRSWGSPPMEGTPKALRGKELVITCYVGADGRLERYELAIPIDDGHFRDMLNDVITGFRFTPARDSLGRPVRGVAPVTITLGNR
ncbi:MAG: hypothetical protein JF590_06375, partial [Gemmatimonadetes bacterium]|nr:hypothetical protein [Gemmatimonadota bacterium]